jgi:hypothetical protein
MITKTETWKDENGDSLLIIPDKYSDEFAVDDVVEFLTTRQGDIAFENLSCITVPSSRLKRDFNSIQRRLISDDSPLKRVVVTLKNKKIALVNSADDLDLAALVCKRKGQTEIEVKLEEL